MLVPIRCFTCGGVIGDKYYKFAKRIKEGEDPKEILDSLGLKRYCCRRMVLANVDIIDQILPYYEAIARRKIEFASDQTGT
jgi:DNA-directed RNA polymerase subunit N